MAASTIIAVVSAILAICWVPVGLFFWKSWRQRGAPLSLAICGLVGFPIYTNATAWMFLKNDPFWTVTVLAVVNALILVNFYLCFRWQRVAFPNARTSPLPTKSRPKFRLVGEDEPESKKEAAVD